VLVTHTFRTAADTCKIGSTSGLTVALTENDLAANGAWHELFFLLLRTESQNGRRACTTAQDNAGGTVEFLFNNELSRAAAAPAAKFGGPAPRKPTSFIDLVVKGSDQRPPTFPAASRRVFRLHFIGEMLCQECLHFGAQSLFLRRERKIHPNPPCYRSCSCPSLRTFQSAAAWSALPA